MIKKTFIFFLSLTLLCGLSVYGFSLKGLKRVKFQQNGLLIKYKQKSQVKPIKVKKEGAFFKVYLNAKTKNDVVISSQSFISRLLNVVQLGATPMTVEQDKNGVFLKIPVFTKMYRYEAIINGYHFSFYAK